MGKVFEAIDGDVQAFLAAQRMFFVATAPLAADGLVNLSPKGLDTFRVLDAATVAYLDLTGSGIETVAHAKENGRIVFMFCAFEGRPRIVRLHGRATVLEPGDPDFARLRPLFPDLPGTRSIVRAAIYRIADSCGYAVPLYEYRGQRDQLVQYAERLGPDALQASRQERNAHSLDGLPGVRRSA